MDKKFDCFKCKHRGRVAGSCHSSCKHPSLGKPSAGEEVMSILASVGRVPSMMRNNDTLNIEGDSYGISKGWFNFPDNFDPTWLKNCDGFELKDSEDTKEVTK